MPKLIMMRGLPASGKTTYCKNYIKDHPNTVRINNDDLRRSLFGGNFNFKKHEALIDVARNQLIHNYMILGLDIIIDNLNLHPKHERNYTNQINFYNSIEENKFKYEFEIITFDTPLEECIKRDRERSKEEQVGEKVIRQWYRDFMYKEPFKLEQDGNLPHAIICDLDGTLALFGNKNPYDRDFENDEVNIPVSKLLEIYHKYPEQIKIILVSGRDGLFREQTYKFLERNRIWSDQLLMREIGDKRPDEVIKKEIFQDNIQGRFFVEFVLDDRNKVVKLWRELGLTCLQVAEGDF